MGVILTLGKRDNSVEYVERRAVRAVVFDDIGRVALTNVLKMGHHGLPGGGIDEGETEKKALKREIREETGATISILDEVGETVEHRDFLEPPVIIYNKCYFCAESGERKSPKFTEQELEVGLEIKWVEIDEAIRLMESDEPVKEKGKWVVKRDLFILKKVKEIVEQ